MLLIVGMALIISFAVAWITSIIGIFYAIPFVSFLGPNSTVLSLVGLFNIIIVIGIPLLALALFVLRVAFKTKVHRRWKTGLTIFWGLNIASLFMVSTFIARDFSTGTEIDQNFDITFHESDTLFLEISKNPYEHVLFRIGDQLQMTKQELVSSMIELNIEKSESDEFQIAQQNYAMGMGLDEANRIADAIDFQIKMENGKLILPPNFVIQKGEKWRNQRIKLHLKVPVGKYVKIGKGTEKMLHDIDLIDRRDNPWSHKNKTWKMESEGLAITDAESESYNNHFPNKDFNSLQIDGKMKVMIEQGDFYNVRLSGDHIYTEQVDVVQSERNLTVSTELKRTSSPLRLYITLPKLDAIQMENTDDIRIRGFKQEKMTIGTQGNFEVKGYVDIDSLFVTQSGRNEIDLRGKGQFIQIALDENARLDAEKYSAKEAVIEASNGSDAKLAVSGQIHQKSDESSSVKNAGGTSSATEQ